MKVIGSVVVFCILLGAQLEEMTRAGAQDRVIVTAAQVNGTWCRSPDGEFKIWALGKQKLRVEFYGVYEGRGGINVGGGSEIASIEGDTAIFNPFPEEKECKIIMKFTKVRLDVEQEGTCGFGHNVTASGAYRKMSSRKPKFGSLDDRVTPPCKERNE